jgi:hypothetical protein
MTEQKPGPQINTKAFFQTVMMVYIRMMAAYILIWPDGK